VASLHGLENQIVGLSYLDIEDKENAGGINQYGRGILRLQRKHLNDLEKVKQKRKNGRPLTAFAN
jgi:hypothetical protein